MKMKIAMAAGFAALLALAPAANAALAITDGGFDGTADASEDIVSWFDYNDTPNGWWEGTSEANAADPFGSKSVIFGDLNPTGGGRWLYQEIGTKEDGITYDLSFDFSQPSDGNANRIVGLEYEIFQGTFAGADGTDLTGLTSIDTGSTALISDLAIHNYSSTLDLSSANTTDSLWIRFSNVAGTGATDDGSWVCLDNVAVVPEPATFGMFAVFGAAIVFARRRMVRR